jgi:hypothetical protein
MDKSTADIGAATTVRNAEREPTIKCGDTPHPVLLKRIDRTVYTVAVHFSQTSKETLQDKLLRLIERNAQND